MALTRVPRKKVAIVGSGSAGIGALWALNRTHHDVYLYEAADRLGGHTNTQEFKYGKFKTLVDTGFIVLNTATYPNFINFLKSTKVPTVPTEMTFGVSRDKGAFEWAGTSLKAVFAQRWNIINPMMWRMIFDIIRFNHFALDLLKVDQRVPDYPDPDGKDSKEAEQTIGDYLAQEGYSDAFRDDYLIPMTAAVWSTSPEKCTLEFPAVTLVRFMWNHHLLTTVGERPQWLTLPNGAQSYIDAVMKGFPPNHVFLNTAVSTLTNEEDGRVRLRTQDGDSTVFDHVIVATHGDQALSIIEPEADQEEIEILSGFQTSKNTVIMHSDLSLMPKNKEAWSAWNYITESSLMGANVDQVCLTYNMNILQHIPREIFGDVLVTLNPLHLPPQELVQGRYSYSHPLYNNEAIQSQYDLPRIQNTRNISYCGAWTGYGFHEDGFSSGIKVAQDHLGAVLPFNFVDSTFGRDKARFRLRDFVMRMVLLMIQTVIAIVELFFGVDRTREKYILEIKVNGTKRKLQEW